MDYGLNVPTVLYYYNIYYNRDLRYQINYNLYIYSMCVLGGWRIIMSGILVYYSNNNKVLIKTIFVPKEISLNPCTLLMCREREKVLRVSPTNINISKIKKKKT